MKVSTLAPLLLSPVVLAGSRHTIRHRQASLRRDLLDVCVGLDLDVKLLDILPNNQPLVAGHLDLCLCLSVLPDFCKSNPVGQNVAKLLGGEDKAHDFFANLIHSQPGNQQCHYPEHFVPTCDFSNPCHFDCKDGFVPDNADHPTQCVCAAPNNVCNGQCGNFPRGCPSSVPTPPGGAPGPAPTPRGPTCSQDIIDILVQLNLVVGDLASVKARLDAAVNVGGVNGRGCNDLLQVMINEGTIVHVAGIADLRVKLGLDATVRRRGTPPTPHSAQDIVDLLVGLHLVADLDRIAEIKAKVAAAIKLSGTDGHDCQDVLQAFLDAKVIIDVKDLLELDAKLGIKAKVLKRGTPPTPHSAQDIVDLLVGLHLVADLDRIAEIKAKVAAAIKLSGIDGQDCQDVLQAFLDAKVIIGVKDLLELDAKLGIKAKVLRRGGPEPQTGDDLVKALVALNVIVGDVADVTARILAAVKVGGVDGRECDHLLEVLLQEGAIVYAPGLAALREKLGLRATVLKRGDGPHTADDLVNLLVKLNLVGEVLDIADIAAQLVAAVAVGGVDGHECNDLLEVFLKQRAIVNVLDIVDLRDKLGLCATVLKRGDVPHTGDDIANLLVNLKLVGTVLDIVDIRALLVAVVKVGGVDGRECNDLLDLLVKQGAIINVLNIADLRDRLGLSASVLKRGDSPRTANDILDLLLHLNLLANVSDLLFANDGLLAFLHLGPLSDDQCDDFLTLLLKNHLILEVTDLLDLKSRLGLGLDVLRRGYPSLNALD